MRKAMVLSMLALAGPLSSAAQAQQAFEPERVTVAPDLKPGERLFVTSENRVQFIDPQELKHQAQLSLSTPYNAKVSITEDGATIYAAATYFSRGWSGTREDIVVAYDVLSLKPKFEIPVLKKIAPVAFAKEGSLLSSDGRRLLLQNATPATSISVVDLSARKQVGEIPTPGCWGLYAVPAHPDRFITLCGDGKLATYTLNAKGTAATSEASEKIFDAGTDPLFVDAEQKGNTWLFISFNGNIYEVDVAGSTARLTTKFSITQGVKGKWVPGGSQLLAYMADSDVLYVLMHDRGFDGSHHEPAKEVWAVDMKTRSVLSRTTVQPLESITVVGGANQRLYAFGKHNLIRYEVNRSAGYTVREDAVMKLDDHVSYLEVR